MDERRRQTRRRWLGTCAGVAGITALAGCSESDETSGNGTGNGNGAEENGNGADSLGGEWPMYGVDLQNTAHHPTATGPTGDALTERKIVDTGETGLYPVAIADGTLFGHSAGQKIYALDLETETIEWEGEISGAPTVHDGMVYGPVSDETLYGYDVDDGTQWESERNESVDGFTSHAIPTAAGIFVTSEQGVWKFDLDSGEYTKVVDISSARGTTDWPAFGNNSMYIGRLGEVHAINVETAEIEWSFEPDEGGGFFDSNPALADGLLYAINSDGHLHAIDVDSGEEEWGTDIEITAGSPAVANGMVFLTGLQSVVAIDATDGTIEWENGDDLVPEPYDPVVADGICYVSTSYKVHGYDVETGELVRTYERPDDSDIRFSASPTVFDGAVYLPSSDNSLYAIEDA